ncbi:MAG: hypothetical protein BYD32DRAFT_438867 [Podila humilis]|nr:MAG: hypothetical protein BYD32DRAFT_438867 [Podila humilis]
MLFRQFTVVAIAALTASATAIPVTSSPAITDPAVMSTGMVQDPSTITYPQDPSMAVISHPPTNASDDSNDDPNASKWGGGWGWGGWGWPSWSWGWPWGCWW